MDENEAEILRQIYTRIGMIMEDASIIALELGGPRSTLVPVKVDELRRSIDAIAALVDTAQALHK